MEVCIFCGVADKNISQHEIIWSDTKHLAFLDIHPAKEGHTLLIPRKHSDNIWLLSETEFQELFDVARKVALLLKTRLNCENVAIVTEGSGIAHSHVHLIPLRYGEKLGDFGNTKRTKEELKTIADKITGSN
jgi:histidine triad (HIT) family protein